MAKKIICTLEQLSQEYLILRQKGIVLSSGVLNSFEDSLTNRYSNFFYKKIEGTHILYILSEDDEEMSVYQRITDVFYPENQSRFPIKIIRI